jgi:hypothetical protein
MRLVDAGSGGGNPVTNAAQAQNSAGSIASPNGAALLVGSAHRVRDLGKKGDILRPLGVMSPLAAAQDYKARRWRQTSAALESSLAQADRLLSIDGDLNRCVHSGHD